jgi:hypothetical protein
MQVRDGVADHRRVHVLRAGHLAQCPARPAAPLAHAGCLGVGQVGQPWRVPPRLDEQVPEVGGRAAGAQHVRRDDVRDQDQLILGHWPAGQHRPAVPVLAAHEAVGRAIHVGHVSSLAWVSPGSRR